MPIYEYECPEGHVFEVLQAVGEPEIEQCRYCKGGAHRILSPANFVLKGAGFYVNDYKKKRESGENSPPQKDTKPGKPENDAKGASQDP